MQHTKIPKLYTTQSKHLTGVDRSPLYNSLPNKLRDGKLYMVPEYKCDIRFMSMKNKLFILYLLQQQFWFKIILLGVFQAKRFSLRPNEL